MSSFEGAGPESEQCAKLIEAHKECLRSEGFKVGFSSPFSQHAAITSTRRALNASWYPCLPRSKASHKHQSSIARAQALCELDTFNRHNIEQQQQHHLC